MDLVYAILVRIMVVSHADGVSALAPGQGCLLTPLVSLPPKAIKTRRATMLRPQACLGAAATPVVRTGPYRVQPDYAQNGGG